jgi:hypothetical protein
MDKIKKEQCCGLRIWIREENPRSYFRELRNYFLVKILKLFGADRDPGIF